MINVAVINPISTGQALVDALREYGARVIPVWTAACAEEYATDRASEKEMWDDGLASRLCARVDHVIAGSEIGVSAAEELAAILDVPRHESDLAGARQSKTQMYAALEAAGLDAPRTRTFTSLEDIETAAAALGGFPLFVKPDASAAADGCAVAEDLNALRSAARAALEAGRNFMRRRNTSVLVQEVLVGQQYIVNTVSTEGVHHTVGYYEANYSLFNGRPVSRDKILITREDDMTRRLQAYTIACLDALGIRHGAAHTELRLTDRGPVIVEVNSRHMGFTLDRQVFGEALGYSHATALAESLVDPHRFRSRMAAGYHPSRALAIAPIIAPAGGMIRDRDGLLRVAQLPSFRKFALLKPVGAMLEPAQPFGLGAAYFVHDNELLLRQDLSRFHTWEDAGEVVTVY
jgi:D-alanine-D-alanine ligase-like ATP-grasp enzyme